MGCKGLKSIISVRNDLIFFDLIVQQIEVRVKFVMEFDLYNYYCVCVYVCVGYLISIIIIVWENRKRKRENIEVYVVKY